MAQKLYEESNIQAIADAIRSKNGTTDTYKVADMADAILILDGGDASGLPEEALTISGVCSDRFKNGGWDWFIETYGDKITTNNIGAADYMFYGSDITEIPFELNFSNTGGNCNFMFGLMNYIEKIPAIDFNQTESYRNCATMFRGCNAKEIGKLSNLYPSAMDEMFYKCENLRALPEFENLNLDRILTYASASADAMFQACYSLRSIPEDFLKQFKGVWSSQYFTIHNSAFMDCYTLDEIKGLPVLTGTYTANLFNNEFSNCHRIKNVLFETQDDGTPYTANWKGQTIVLTVYAGYTTNGGRILDYNSGITADKQVTDDATYQALKDDPDWWTMDKAYSRYNHDSAVATLNSLPDTSAYLAANGGTNIIKFEGACGSATDGGAINTLTEAEVAVATAKGWTVYVDNAVFTGATE